MMDIRNAKWGFVAALALAGSGCAATDETDGMSLDTEFTRTMVHLGKDGTKTIRQTMVTLRQQIAEREAEARGERIASHRVHGGQGLGPNALYEDTSCDPDATLRMFRYSGYTGPQLCIGGDGDGVLNDYYMWGGKVTSFKPGGMSVHFESTYFYDKYDDQANAVVGVSLANYFGRY